jgi:hypothetical protein
MSVSDWMQSNEALLAQCGAVLLFGGIVGAGELVSRYRDAPGKAIKNLYGLYYIAINAVAALLALMAVRTLGLEFGLKDKLHAMWIVQATAAGFGAMSIFRSSAFIARVGDQDVAIGPSAFLTSILSATDREVDRRRAEQRADAVQAAMAGIDFQQSNQALPVLALALMQNLPEEDAKKLNQELEGVRKNDGLPNSTKNLCLGLSLMNVVGEDVLSAAVAAMRRSLETSGTGSQVQEKRVFFSSMLGRFGIGKPPPVTNSSAAQPGTADGQAMRSGNEPPGNEVRAPNGLVS